MADRINQQLGNYRIVRLIGHGGFAEVYLGEHIYLKTQVAIKILQTKVSNEDDMKGFLQEAQTIARLVHPNIVRVTDFGVDGETPYLVMDYAANGTLRQRHPKGSVLPLPTIVTYVKQTAAALQYAHDEKLIHRDIKPENMLLGRKNEILLSDFGIALTAQSSRYQSTQDVVGTVAYMSPEQIQGRPRPASDQYSLGIVVYEWLSGDRPFHGSFTELCTQHMFASPRPLRERVPSIHPLVEQVVSMALAKEAKQRFGSVQAFANALEQASNMEDTSETYVKTPAPPPPPPKPASSVSPTIASSPSGPIQRSAPPQQPTPIPPPPPPQGSGYSYPSYPAYPPQQYSSYPQQQYAASSAAYPGGQKQSSAAQPSDEKVKIWSIGVRQIVATVIGIVIFAALDYGLQALFIHLPNDAPFFNPLIPGINNSAFGYSFTLAAILADLVFTVPLLFSVEFGPLVGLVVVVAGSLIGDHIAQLYAYPQWYWYLSDGIFAFIPGFALLFTKGRYNNPRAIAIAIAFSLIGIVVSSIVVAIGDSVAYQTWAGFLPEFLGVTLASVIGLILLPVLLVIYNAIAGNKRRA